MAEVRDTSSIIDAAAEAAGAGDFSSAAEHLRRAVALEEASFGPMHAELANVLNNLGVVYERLDRPDKAEACYRRAYAIAKAAFAPGDAAILLSENNLREFCAARDIPFEPPPAVSAPPAASSQRVAEALVADVPVRASRPEPSTSASTSADLGRQPQSTSPRKTMIIVALVVVAAIVGVVLIATRSSTTNQPPVPTAAATAPTATEPTPSETAQPAPPGPAATSPSSSQATPPAQPAATPVARATPRSVDAGKTAKTETRRPSTASAVAPTVVSAQLCRALQTTGDWRCTAVSDAVTPGPLYFFTRLKASSDTTVEHRWYRGDRLQQKMTLRVRANQGTGYRTYSRATVAAGRAGEWRVDLQTMDGKVLHQERFTVGP